MEKIIIPSYRCIPGMITANPVIDLKSGNMILPADKMLTESIIKDILNFIHNDIWVYLDSSNKVWNLSKETITEYQNYSNTLKSILSPIASESINDISILETFSNSIPTTFNKNHTILGCTHLIQALDYNTFNHSLNVALICILICKWCNFKEDFTSNCIIAALLHDIGLLNLSFDPFNINTSFSRSQQLEYEKHPIYSFNLCNKIENLDPSICKAILHHHENCNHTGFPIKLSASYIPTMSKVLYLADCFEQLKRHHHIFDIIKLLSIDRISEFDTTLVLTFCSYISTYYLGTYVTLNDGTIGEVIFINTHCLYRPIIKVNDDFINLYEHPELTIVSTH